MSNSLDKSTQDDIPRIDHFITAGLLAMLLTTMTNALNKKVEETKNEDRTK